jgi:hypothetical protein
MVLRRAMPWRAMPTPNRGSVVPPLEQSTRGQAHPLAATIALRSMVDFTLANARSSRYRHAAHLAAIRQNHARKSGFWKRMQDIRMAQSG